MTTTTGKKTKSTYVEPKLATGFAHDMKPRGKQPVFLQKGLLFLWVLSTSIFIFSSGTACIPPVEETPDDFASGVFEALTYNVAGLPEGLSSSEPQLNIPQISPRLNAYDLILAQEDFTYQRELRQDAEHEYKSAPLEDYERLIGDGLNRFSHFAFATEDVERVRWVACYGGIDFGSSDCLANKGFSVATHQLDVNVSLVVVNLHAEAGGGEEDNLARSAGLDQLVEYLEENFAGEALLLGGDTNLDGFHDVDEPVLLSFMERLGLVDACRTVSCDDERIDRFLYRSSSSLSLNASAWSLAEEMVTSEGTPLSDHEAIHVTFEFSAR